MPAELQQLGPVGEPVPAARMVEGLRLRDEPGPGGRPRVVVAMIGSADGRATVEGRAGGLGNPADRAVLRSLRAASDAMLVGSATLIKERYATLLDPEQREQRVARGLAPEPLMATISRGLDPRLFEVPLFGETGTRLLVCTESGRELPAAGADVRALRLAPGTLTARACIEHLHSEHGARVVVSEGGPTLLRELLAERLVDDLVLTIAPKLVAGAGPAVVHGEVFDPPLDLSLRAALRGGDHLFLHYVPAVA